jgi:hypothetical protein
MKFVSNHSQDHPGDLIEEEPNDTLSGITAERWLRTKERLASSQFELMAMTVLPKPPPSAWGKLAMGRETITVPGGVFSGPLMNGVIVRNAITGNYDPREQQLHFVADAEMLTNDGATIYKTDRGLWRGTANAIERLIAGEAVADCQYYLIGILKFSVTHPRYAWLETGTYLSRGVVEGNALKISQFQVLDVGR